jgi:hypothetical protein
LTFILIGLYLEIDSLERWEIHSPLSIFKGVRKIMTKYSDYLRPLFESYQGSMCDFFGNPALWSDHMIQKTLERSGGKPFNVEDVRSIIKDYLAVLSDSVRKGGTF